jgi:hypothetical protein
MGILNSPCMCNVPCGGKLEYLHRCPASRGRRNGNPVSGGINVSPCHWGTYVQRSVVGVMLK